jgi:hypothetical protein
MLPDEFSVSPRPVQRAGFRRIGLAGTIKTLHQ